MRSNFDIKESGRIWDFESIGPLNGALIKLPDCGTCSAVWCENENGYEHVSVSPKHKFRIPSWEDMCTLKEIFFEDEEEVYQIHPKKSEYVNLSKNCLHLWKPIGHELGELVDNSGMYEDREDVSNTNVGNKWIPVEWRELTEEEKKQYRNTDAVEYMLDCKLPEDSEEIIVTDGKRTWTDINGIDEFYYLESGNDWKDMKAWMPLPEPYKQNDEGAEK